MNVVPEWTKAGYWSLGRDPLGMQATSVRIYRTLVPGLTNVTNRLRYYSFYCWVVALFAEMRHADDDRQWRIFIRRAEALYALACQAINPHSSEGLAGSEWARKYWDSFEGRDIDLRPHTDSPGDKGQYLMARRGNFGQFYVRSMLEVRLLHPSSGVPIVTDDRGQALAGAFASAVGDATIARLARAIDKGTLSKSDLLSIGEAVHPSAIRAGTTEMKLLRDFLWAQEPDASGDTTRRTSAWLLLDFANKGVSVWDERSVRRALYQRVLPDGSAYPGRGRVIDRWRAYQANELCHIALEAWLNRIAAALLDEPVPPAQVLADIVASSLPAGVRRISFAKWAREVSSASAEVEEGLSAVVTQALQRPADTAKNSDVLLSAAKLLAALWQKWGDGAHGVREEVAAFSVHGGSSLAGVLATLAEQKDAPVSAALAATLRRHIIEAHLAIAARKLASGTFTYRFLLEDGLLSDGWVAPYAYTNPRLSNLAQFLLDAKLVDGDGALTQTGLKYLNAHQPA